MLTFESPTYEIDGIVIYRDHAVTEQFYYTAPQPRLSGSSGKPMFELLAYSVQLEHSVLSGTKIPEELGAGFLTMGTECSLRESKRSVMMRELQSQAGIDQGNIRLSPIPYHKGTVSVIALDAFGVPGAQPENAPQLNDKPVFVEEIIGTGTPSLLGDLRCIFSLSLSQKGVAFLQGLMTEQASPVGVVYNLGFYGLRPSVKARITADLSRIYDYFGGGLGGSYRWFKADIGMSVEKLEEERAITVDLTSEAVGEDARKSKELALSLFKEQIIQSLFQPTAPSQDLGSLASAASSAVGAATSALGNQGSGNGSISFTLQKKNRMQLGRVEYDFSERAPEERIHCPQGFLQTLLPPDAFGRQIHLIDLGNSFFDLLEVLVTGPTPEEFATLGIRQIECILTYGEPGDADASESERVVFRADATGDKTIAIKRRSRKSLSYTTKITYEFTRNDNDSDFFRYELEPVRQTGRSFRINPYADFGLLDVEIELGAMPSDVKRVDVALTYGTDTFTAEKKIRLLPGDPTAQLDHWQVRTRGIERNEYSAAIQLTFDDGSYTVPAIRLRDRILRIDNPFPANRELLIKAAPKSEDVHRITVELEYDDAAHLYRRRKMIHLEKPFTSTLVSWPVVDRNLLTVRYRVTIHEAAFLSEGEWLETDDPSIIVGTEGHRINSVQVHLIGPTLVEAGIDAVQLTIEFPDAGPDGTKSTLFTDGTQTTVTAVLPPGKQLRYRYATTTFAADGTVRTSAFKESTSQMLVIPIRNL